MIAVDSSVWIDHLRGDVTRQVALLREKLAAEPGDICVPDLVYLKVLRGVRLPQQRRAVESAFDLLESADIAGLEACKSALIKHQKLRLMGFTLNKTVDLLIASWCIDHRVALLHDDKDFAAFEKLGLTTI
jgi:predicted nucleic acid-binding protein